MVWGDGGAYATWFSADPEKIQGINMLPITGGHFYLGYHPDYVKKNYAEIVKRRRSTAEWQDIIWEFLATGDPAAALANFRANSTFPSEEGETKAHTFHWIDNLAALGIIDTTVTANHPLAVVFKKDGARTYVASNVTGGTLTVTYSDGTRLTVGPARPRPAAPSPGPGAARPGRAAPGAVDHLAVGDPDERERRRARARRARARRSDEVDPTSSTPTSPTRSAPGPEC